VNGVESLDFLLNNAAGAIARGLLPRARDMPCGLPPWALTKAMSENSMPTQCIMQRQGRCLRQENRILESPAGELFHGLFFSADRGGATVNRIGSGDQFRDRR
jgi:hypothetical protein